MSALDDLWDKMKGEADKRELDTIIYESDRVRDLLTKYGALTDKEYLGGLSAGWGWELGVRLEGLLKNMTPEQLAKIQAYIKENPIYSED